MSLNLHLVAERAREDAARWERARCQFILNSPAAQGREAGAWVLAMKTDIPPQEAVDYLATLPTTSRSSPSPTANEPVTWADIAAGMTERKH